MDEIAHPSVAALLDLLEVREQGDGVFVGAPAQDAAGRSRVFGGQVIGQALAAATFTVTEDRLCHSLHAYFVRPGKPGRPIEYEVSAIYEGKQFVTRKVVAVQRNELICELTASFTDTIRGADHQYEMPDTPPPEAFPSEAERIASTLAAARDEVRPMLELQLQQSPFELIYVDPHSFGAPRIGRESAPRRPNRSSR